MTKKDYVLIASSINQTINRKDTDLPTMTMLMANIATRLADDNPRFDSVRFFDACLARPKD